MRILKGDGMNWRSNVAPLTALVSLTLSTGRVEAAEISHNTDYSISLAGLPIAKASFHTELDSGRYKISGTLKSAGIADILSSTSGQTSVSGTVGRDRLN